jgi:hypothetical protein
VAALLGVESVEFPSNHAGFLAGEHAQPGGDPEGWAKKACSRSSTPDRHRPAPIDRPTVDMLAQET